jgi:hypothetical protein
MSREYWLLLDELAAGSADTGVALPEAREQVEAFMAQPGIDGLTDRALLERWGAWVERPFRREWLTSTLDLRTLGHRTFVAEAASDPDRFQAFCEVVRSDDSWCWSGPVRDSAAEAVEDALVHAPTRQPAVWQSAI